MKLRYVPLEPELVKKINPVAENGLAAAYWHINQKRPSAHAEIVLSINGPVAAWGVNEKWQCVGEVWLAIDQGVIGNFGVTRDLIRLGRERLRILEEEFGFLRLEAAFGVNVPTYGLARLCGFEMEGLLKNYGLNGRGDYYLMSRTRSTDGS